MSMDGKKEIAVEYAYIWLEFDKFETSAVNLDYFLELGGIVVFIGFGGVLDVCRVLSLDLDVNL
jgi:hypothetical protein